MRTFFLPQCQLGKAIEQWAEIAEELDLVCELCEEKDPHCVHCMTKHLAIINLFNEKLWDLSERCKELLYQRLCEHHRTNHSDVGQVLR